MAKFRWTRNRFYKAKHLSRLLCQMPVSAPPLVDRYRAFVMSHPEYGVQKVGVEGHLPYKFKGERADIRLALAPSESVAVSASPSALPAQAVGEVTDAMRKAFDDRNNSLEADERDGIIAAILALAAPMPQAEPTLTVEIHGKFYEVPIAVQLQIVSLRSLLQDWLTAFADSIEGGEEDELVKFTRSAIGGGDVN